MTDDNKKVLSLGAKPKLELKKPVSSDGAVAAGSVKQSFSHGRSKTVAVEVKRGTGKKSSEMAGQQMVTGPEPGTSVSVSGRGRATSAMIRQLTPEERDARARALRGAVTDGEKQGEFETASPDHYTPSENGEPTGSPQDILRQREMAEMRQIHEVERSDADRRKVEDEARGRDMQATRRPDIGAKIGVRAGESALGKANALTKRGGDDEEEGASRRKAGRAPPARRSMTDARRVGRMTVTQALSTDSESGGRQRSMASMRRRIEREKRQAMGQQEQIKITRDVVLPEAITVQELANRMAERSVDVIKALMKLGVMATITQIIDADTAELVAAELGHRVRRVAESDIESGLSGVT